MVFDELDQLTTVHLRGTTMLLAQRSRFFSQLLDITIRKGNANAGSPPVRFPFPIPRVACRLDMLAATA